MIRPTKKDIGRKVRYKEKIGFEGKTEDHYGTLISYSDQVAYCHWDGLNNKYTWMSFLDELEWSKKK